MSEIVRKMTNVKWQSALIILVIAMVAIASDGCKSTGKLSKKERKAQIETAKKQMHSIIDGTTTLSLDQQEKLITDVVNKNLKDPELNQLIIQAQQKVKAAYSDKEKSRMQKIDSARAALLDMLLNKDNKTADQLQAEVDAIKAQNLKSSEIDELVARVEKKIQEMRSYNSGASLPLKTKLENAFNGIVSAAKAGNPAQADNLIKNALPLFASPDVPVLIIIDRSGSTVDYDKPTTAARYLNLLKDTKSSKNAIDAIQLDATGKIKELDLIKQY